MSAGSARTMTALIVSSAWMLSFVGDDNATLVAASRPAAATCRTGAARHQCADDLCDVFRVAVREVDHLSGAGRRSPAGRVR